MNTNFYPPEKLVGLPCLSIWQPWAWCIFHAGKDVENRDWFPVRSMHGKDLAIHAGKNIKEFEEAKAYILEEFGIEVPDLIPDKKPPGEPPDGAGGPPALPLGCIIGVVRLDFAGAGALSRWAAAGNVHWKLSDPRPLQTPVIYRGLQKLFTITKEGLEAKRLAGTLAPPATPEPEGFL